MRKNNLDDIFSNFNFELSDAKNCDNLNQLKIRYLGRAGVINKLFQQISSLSHKDKIDMGKELNNLKLKFSSLLDEKYTLFNSFKIKEHFDVTLPSVGITSGSTHVLTKSIESIETFFLKSGFDIINGFEIDTDYYNFQALNMPETHPSRNMHDTFYITKNLLLRTHTSNMQIHTMESKQPPFKILSCGKVYRRDSDISHTPMFHQAEGFVVDKNISIANLKFILSKFLNYFFKDKITLRIRASYFPFTEPSMEIDIQCVNCFGRKCSLCKHSGWIEVLGCGIIHPKVLENCNIDSKVYKGLAFGMGIERLSMIKYNIDDLRLFFENNIDFLKQF